MTAGPILVAAGGTGGHMFPALALAEVLVERGLPVLVVTDARGARYLPAHLEHELIHAGSPSGGLRARLAGVLALLRGTFASIRLVRRLKPRAAACFGGYGSVPVGLAAAFAGKPLLLHEQNAVFGRANRLLARFARTIALNVEETLQLPKGLRRITLVTGNPVRPGFKLQGPAYRAPAAADPFRLLVIGGSQGARIFSDVLPPALAGLPESARRRLSVVQQCRPEDLERVRQAHGLNGVTAEVETFFGDMPARMAAADLIISRAGASSLTEIMAMGRPSLLVPYAAAADDHQRANAEALAKAGGCLTIRQGAFTAERLATELEKLMQAPEILDGLAAVARRRFAADAAIRLADAVLGMLPGSARQPAAEAAR